jgi:hypothetical protein
LPYTLETSGLPKFVRHLWDERFSLTPVGCFTDLQINVRKWQPNLASVLELLTHFTMFEACGTLESGTRETLESGTCEALES